MSNNLLAGLREGYVDGLIRAGTPQFREIFTATNRRFQMGADEEVLSIFSVFGPGPLQRWYSRAEPAFLLEEAGISVSSSVIQVVQVNANELGLVSQHKTGMPVRNLSSCAGHRGALQGQQIISNWKLERSCELRYGYPNLAVCCL